jgi:hypothetical protein
VVGVSQKAVSRLLKRARAAEEGGAEGDAAGAALHARAAKLCQQLAPGGASNAPGPFECGAANACTSE